MTRTYAILAGLVFVILASALGLAKWELHELRRAIEERTTERDSLAAEAAVQRARANGWVVEFAEGTAHLSREIASRDSTLAALSRDLRASGVRVSELTSLVASMEGRISSTGVPDSAPASDSTGVPASWSGSVDDGLLKGSWRFFRPDPRLLLDYRADVPVELIQGLAGDGRTVVMARSPDPRVRVSFAELLVDRPQPVTVRVCSWGTRIRWALGGLVLGAGAWEVAR